MDQSANNFDPSANRPFSCNYDVLGCIDPAADNLDGFANVEDNSCILSGCTDPQAINYSTIYNNDDNSCEYSNDPVIHVPSGTVGRICDTDDGIPLCGINEIWSIDFQMCELPAPPPAPAPHCGYPDSFEVFEDWLNNCII